MIAPVQWPRLPPLPPPGQPVLLRVAATDSRPDLRPALRRVLAAWSGLPPAQALLRETPRGPVWPGLLAGYSLDISLSYAGEEGWIGLLRGGWIGIDAMRIEPFAEAQAVARHYLAPAARDAIQPSRQPALAFALAWTDMEARLKCVKRGLVEWSPARAAATAHCESQSIVLADGLVVTVASTNRSNGD